MATGDSTLKEVAGNLAMAGGKVTGAGAATTAGDLVRFEQAMLGTLGAVDNTVPRSDGTGTTTLQASALVISDAGVASGVTFADPSAAQDPSTKAYVDNKQFPAWEWGATAAPNTTSSRWANPNPGGAITVAERTAFIVAPFDCTLVEAGAFFNVPQVTDTITVTVQVNAVDTAIAFAMAATVASNSDIAHTVAVTKYQKIAIKLVQTTGTEVNSLLDARFFVKYRRTGA